MYGEGINWIADWIAESIADWRSWRMMGIERGKNEIKEERKKGKEKANIFSILANDLPSTRTRINYCTNDTSSPCQAKFTNTCCASLTNMHRF